MQKILKDFGLWPSPIAATDVSQSGKRFGTLVLDRSLSPSSSLPPLYWEETRPSEGRTLIVSEKGDHTPAPYNVCNRVHEYGGKSFTVNEGVLYFVNGSDQRIYVQREEVITPLTAEGTRFADLQFTTEGLIAVAQKGEENFLALIDFASGHYSILASGFDFYASPTLNLKSQKLAWLCWNLPHMPWEGNYLFEADFKNKILGVPHLVVGGDAESIFQPQWGPEGHLYFVSDRSGWWNLYRASSEIEPLYPLNAEFGLPQWLFGFSTYSFAGSSILTTFSQKGLSYLALLDLRTKNLEVLNVAGSYFSQIHSTDHSAYFIKGAPDLPPCITRLDLHNRMEALLASSASLTIDPLMLSVGAPQTFPSFEGREAYGFYYPPRNKSYEGTKEQLPPLIVKIHGGPTAHSINVFNLSTQYWTSRGFALLEVNHAGSSGYGRAFRESLKGNWGLYDWQDALKGAQFLIDQGLVDTAKIFITGGSAGGYTTLAALTFTSFFAGGASYYGISDLMLLTKETHKFESGYLDYLIGPLPEAEALYQARSPLQNREQLNQPVIFFQGSEDKIVPLNQAELLFHALQERGVSTKMVIYEGEGHGFRQAKNIARSLQEELEFYLSLLFSLTELS